MLDFSRLAHDLRWIAIDSLGLHKGLKAKVTVRVENTARMNPYRVLGPRAEKA
jgi:signal transduction histidine kinase